MFLRDGVDYFEDWVLEIKFFLIFNCKYMGFFDVNNYGFKVDVVDWWDCVFVVYWMCVDFDWNIGDYFVFFIKVGFYDLKWLIIVKWFFRNWFNIS